MDLFATIPLQKAVKAAAKDSYEDLSRVEESYSHWAVRALREINRRSLKLNRRRVTVVVNNGIGRLPIDFREIIFAGFLDIHGRKVPIKMDDNIFGAIHDIEEDCCAKCLLPKGVCEILEQVVTERVITVPTGASEGYPYGGETIGGSLTDETAIETTTKRLFPNGDYVLEKTFPVWDAETESISMETTREVVAVFKIADCGCIAQTESNLDLLKTCCADAYNNYFTECCPDQIELGLKLFPEEGILQFSKPVYFKKFYLEYLGDLPRKNGDFLIPEVALEPIVGWILEVKWRGRKGENERWTRAYNHKKESLKNMRRMLGRLSINDILEIALKPPRP